MPDKSAFAPALFVIVAVAVAVIAVLVVMMVMVIVIVVRGELGLDKLVETVGFAQVGQDAVVQVAYDVLQHFRALVAEGAAQELDQEGDAPAVAVGFLSFLVALGGVFQGGCKGVDFFLGDVFDRLGHVVDVHKAVDEAQFLLLS